MHKALCFSSLGPFSVCITYTQSLEGRWWPKLSLEYSTMTNETAQQTKAFVTKPWLPHLRRKELTPITKYTHTVFHTSSIHWVAPHWTSSAVYDQPLSRQSGLHMMQKLRSRMPLQTKASTLGVPCGNRDSLKSIPYHCHCSAPGIRYLMSSSQHPAGIYYCCLREAEWQIRCSRAMG